MPLLIWVDNQNDFKARVDDAIAWYEQEYHARPNAVHVPPCWADDLVLHIRKTRHVHIYCDVPMSCFDEIWINQELEYP